MKNLGKVSYSWSVTVCQTTYVTATVPEPFKEILRHENHSSLCELKKCQKRRFKAQTTMVLQVSDIAPSADYRKKSQVFKR